MTYEEAIQAAQRGDSEGQFEVGVMYAGGEGVPKDAVEAERWLRSAIGQKHTGAMLYLGLLYAHGDVVQQDNAEAERLVRQSAELGFRKAQHALACWYDEGWIVTRDYVLAVHWFREAAKQGAAVAQYLPAERYRYGVRGARKNHLKAWYWFRRAAVLGDDLAQDELDKMHDKMWYQTRSVLAGLLLLGFVWAAAVILRKL